MLIYKATNQINGKLYIGLTTLSLEERKKNHKHSYRYTTSIFHKAIRKYRFENFLFEQIDIAETLEELLEKECHWITVLDTMNREVGYNMLKQDDIKVYSQEVRNKISESQKIRFSKLSDEQKREFYKGTTVAKQGRMREDKNYIGVFKDPRCNSFTCEIRINNKRYRKTFKTEIEAAQHYDSMALELYGPTARLNFPDFLLKGGD